MKKRLCTFILLLISTLAFSQATEPEDFYTYISENLMIPKKARMSTRDGRYIVKFRASPDGSITDIEIPKKLGSGYEEETTAVLNATPPNIVLSMITKTSATNFVMLIRFDPKGESGLIPMAPASSTPEYYALREILVTKFKDKQKKD